MPDSVGAALQTARARLAAGSDHPRRDAELLLAHVLGWDRTALLTRPEHPLTPNQHDEFQSLLARRLQYEPVQYILGEQEFYGLALAVSPAVLIPRPETEHLVEEALERLGPDPPTRVLDVGTGSGAIAIAIAHARPACSVTAVDISSAALDVARSNAQRHGVLPRITFLESNLLTAVEGQTFDMAVSNPPYVAKDEVLEPQVARYEPHAALFAGVTGLEIYQRLIPQCESVLKPGGWLLFEVGEGQAKPVSDLFRGWDSISTKNDLRGIPRVVLAQRA